MQLELEPQTEISQKVETSILRFLGWLDGYGEASFDHQSYFAGSIGRRAKALYYTSPVLGKLAVAPMIFSEAFVPSARKLFWKPQRFPIADAHYAMGFAFLSRALKTSRYYERAVHFLEVLKGTRSPGYERYCWGYPFDWETRAGTMKAQTPFITTVPYVYEAFREVYAIDHNPEWREIMHSIADHGFLDYKDFETSPDASSCSYSPEETKSSNVINAAAYRAFLLTQAAADFSDEKYWNVAQRNLNFVIESQNEDGSWYYATDGERDFVDHFHTCFVLKALAKIEGLRRTPKCTSAIERGINYYVGNLLDSRGLPKPFSRRPRMTVYRRELYDCAECINLAVLLRGRFPLLDEVLMRVLDLPEWQKPDGSFRSRLLLLGWDNVPMHRWAQSQFFRSLCFFLYSESSQPV